MGGPPAALVFDRLDVSGIEQSDPRFVLGHAYRVLDS